MHKYNFCDYPLGRLCWSHDSPTAEQTRTLTFNEAFLLQGLQRRSLQDQLLQPGLHSLPFCVFQVGCGARDCRGRKEEALEREDKEEEMSKDGGEDEKQPAAKRRWEGSDGGIIFHWRGAKISVLGGGDDGGQDGGMQAAWVIMQREDGTRWGRKETVMKWRRLTRVPPLILITALVQHLHAAGSPQRVLKHVV